MSRRPGPGVWCKPMRRDLSLLIPRARIEQAVGRLADKLDADYADSSLVLVGVLKGSFVFLADLIRRLEVPVVQIEFVRVSTYGSSTVSSGEARVEQGPPADAIGGQDVLVIEDIVDSGITTSAVLDYLKQLGPASLRLCALLDKPARRQVPVAIDYVGFTVPNHFVVGYGLDLDEKYRQLPEIYALGE